MTMKSGAKFEEKLICCFKNDTKMVKSVLSTQNSQNFYFDWFLLYQVYEVWPKTYREDIWRYFKIFHDTEESCKIWRKPELWFGKQYKEYGKFSLEHLSVSKLGLW